MSHESNKISLQTSPYGNQLVTLGLKCIFSVLNELNRRDPELCSQALSSLLQLIQNMPVDALTHETYTSVKNMHEMLTQLRLQGFTSFFPIVLTLRKCLFNYNLIDWNSRLDLSNFLRYIRSIFDGDILHDRSCCRFWHPRVPSFYSGIIVL